MPMPIRLSSTKGAKALIGAAAASLALVACATPTPYGPAEQQGGFGFSEVRIEENRFRVSFAGNSLTDLDQVENALLYRAADLAIQNNADWFEIVQRNTDADRSFVDTGFGTRRTFIRHRVYHPKFGFVSVYDPVWVRDDVRLREVTRYEASAEVILGTGDRPDRPTVYGAIDVQDSLRSAITFPTV